MTEHERMPVSILARELEESAEALEGMVAGSICREMREAATRLRELAAERASCKPQEAVAWRWQYEDGTWSEWHRMEVKALASTGNAPIEYAYSPAPEPAQAHDSRAEGEAQPVAWSVRNRRTGKHWYTHESRYTAQGYAENYSHNDEDGPSMDVLPLYTQPPPPAGHVSVEVSELDRLVLEWSKRPHTSETSACCFDLNALIAKVKNDR